MSEETLQKIKKWWAGVLKSDIAIVDYRYTKYRSKAYKFWLYITRPYVYDVFLTWLQGEDVRLFEK